MEQVLRKLSEYFSRKFVLSLTSLMGSFALVWNGKPVEDLLGIIAAVLGTYNGANVFQTYVEGKANKNNPNNPETPRESETQE